MRKHWIKKWCVGLAMCCCINPAWAFTVTINGPVNMSTRRTIASVNGHGDITLNLQNFETIGAVSGTCSFGYYDMFGQWQPEANNVPVAVNGSGPASYTWTKTLPPLPWSPGSGRKFDVEFKQLTTGNVVGSCTTMPHTVTQ